MKRILLIVAISILAQLVIAQNKRALLIGISDYQCINKYGGWNNIHGKNDIDLLSSTLKNIGVTVSYLYDRDATKTEILKALNKLVSQCKTGDIIYLHFSTHGQPFEDISGDENDGWDESIVPVDAQIEYIKGKYEGENHLIDDELHEYYTKIRKAIGINGILYVVIDACHAGTSYRGEDSLITRGTNIGFSKSGKIFCPSINKQSNFKIQKQDKQGDICLIEACRSYQSNSEIKENGIYYGALSWYINESIKMHKIGCDFSWIYEVKKSMDKDPRLIRQNIVIESSK